MGARSSSLYPAKITTRQKCAERIHNRQRTHQDIHYTIKQHSKLRHRDLHAVPSPPSPQLHLHSTPRATPLIVTILHVPAQSQALNEKKEGCASSQGSVIWETLRSSSQRKTRDQKCSKKCDRNAITMRSKLVVADCQRPAKTEELICCFIRLWLFTNLRCYNRQHAPTKPFCQFNARGWPERCPKSAEVGVLVYQGNWISRSGTISRERALVSFSDVAGDGTKSR